MNQSACSSVILGVPACRLVISANPCHFSGMLWISDFLLAMQRFQLNSDFIDEFNSLLRARVCGVLRTPI